MAITANLGWKLETAFILVARDKSDITGIARVMREGDATVVADDDMYPVLVVGTQTVEEIEYSDRSDYNVAYVNLDCRTLTRGQGADITGETVTNLEGAVRDMMYEASIASDLSGKVSGLFVYERGVMLDEPTVRDDDDRRRSRIVSVRVNARAVNIG